MGYDSTAIISVQIRKHLPAAPLNSDACPELFLMSPISHVWHILILILIFYFNILVIIYRYTSLMRINC